jgi:hypothetical protein
MLAKGAHRGRVADGALSEVGGGGIAGHKLGEDKGHKRDPEAEEDQGRKTPAEEPEEGPGRQPEPPSRCELPVSR